MERMIEDKDLESPPLRTPTKKIVLSGQRKYPQKIQEYKEKG